jgi:hypothetical protein
MNRGLLGLDGVRGNVVLYQSPPVRLNKYAVATRYSIPHPFPHRPSFVRPILACRVAEHTYSAGDKTIYTPTDATPTTTGLAIIYRPDEVVIVWASGGPGVQLQDRNGNTFLTAAANWDVSFGVIG